jgi:DNA polymerase III epsilon subunit-like protein
MKNRKTILLAVELFQEGTEFSMAFFCEVPEFKSGFMYINLGNELPKNAFWKGFYLSLKRLSKFHDRHLDLAICSSYMTAFNGGKEQGASMNLLGRFSNYSIINSTPFFEKLEKLSILGKIDEKPKGEIFGYQLNQLDDLKNHTIKQLKQEIKEKSFYSDLSMPERGVVLDFETTSKIAKFSKVIEISALKFENGNIIDEYHTLVDPVIKIPKVIRELTGITQLEVAGSPHNFEAMKKLTLYIKDCKVLVGHNINAYDYGLVVNFIKRFQLPMWEGQILCTMKLAKSFKLGYKNHKLETLCDFFGVINEQPHRAWSDTRATFEVMKNLYRKNSLLNLEV